MKDAKIIAIVGPTASGKTSLAIEIAKKLDGEVISVDSRQVYRGLDIGTEKITFEEMNGIPHHMIDVANPEIIYTVREFQRDARACIEDILSRGKTVILAGGSGQYMDAVLYDVSFPEVSPNAKLREDLKDVPLSALLKILKIEDPDRYESIDHNNRPRIIRALEIVDHLGKVPERTESKPLYDFIYFGIDVSREELRKRITTRLKTSLAKELVEEVRELYEKLGKERVDSFGLEYKIIREYLDDEIRKEDLEEKLTSSLMQYAKRQMTWFRKNKDIIWKTREEILARLH